MAEAHSSKSSQSSRTANADEQAPTTLQRPQDADLEAGPLPLEESDLKIMHEALERRRTHQSHHTHRTSVADQDQDAQESLEKPSQQKTDEPDPFLVTWNGPDDPENPLNWLMNYKWFLTACSGLFLLNSSFASSAPSGILREMEEYFGFSQEVGILTISLFVAGYIVGPIVWGPSSERYGRKLTFLVAFIFYTGFSVGCALSKNTGSILVFRFLSGTFAAAPQAVSGAIMADLHRDKTRGIAMSIFALAPFAGPALGPLVSGFIGVTGTDWRWVYWVLTIFAGVVTAVIAFVLPETYGPYLLKKKAQKLRKETSDTRYHSALEDLTSSMSRGELVSSLISSPFVLQFEEPMLLFCNLYMSFIYGVVYLLFEALPFVFEINHGFNSGEEGLAFLALPIGGFFACLSIIFYFNPSYARQVDAMAPKKVEAEVRLEMVIYGAPLLVVVLFWFGWTGNYPSVSYWAPLIAILVCGWCLIILFLGLVNYIVDVYLYKAATALAINTIMRSLFGASFPLFAVQMYEKLGVDWASSLLGFIALVAVPVPFFLKRYGRQLRMKSKNAVVWG